MKATSLPHCNCEIKGEYPLWPRILSRSGGEIFKKLDIQIFFVNWDELVMFDFLELRNQKLGHNFSGQLGEEAAPPPRNLGNSSAIGKSVIFAKLALGWTGSCQPKYNWALSLVG